MYQLSTCLYKALFSCVWTAYGGLTSLWSSGSIWGHRSRPTLAGAMTTSLQWSSVAFTRREFHRMCSRYESSEWDWNYCSFEIDRSRKFHNASDKYRTMQHFVTEMCTHAQFLFQNGALWDMGLLHCGICVTGEIQDFSASMNHILQGLIIDTRAIIWSNEPILNHNKTRQNTNSVPNV